VWGQGQVKTKVRAWGQVVRTWVRAKEKARARAQLEAGQYPR
jgi:hypothetical protein